MGAALTSRLRPSAIACISILLFGTVAGSQGADVSSPKIQNSTREVTYRGCLSSNEDGTLELAVEDDRSFDLVGDTSVLANCHGVTPVSVSGVELVPPKTTFTAAGSRASSTSSTPKY
jgi:hypothetical protein